MGVAPLKLITVHLPEEFLTGLAELVRQRRYPNRSEAIRLAVRDLLKEELWTRSVLRF
jgi:antitoxin ParD1/3/4